MQLRFVLTLIFTALVCLQFASARAEDPVTTGREALESGPNYPWYDAEADSVKRVSLPSRDDDPVKEPLDPGNRNSDWESAPTAPAAPAAGPNFSGSGRVVSMIVQLFFWFILGLLILGIVALLAWAFTRNRWQIRTSESQEPVQAGDETTQIDRVENLPFQVKRPQSDLLKEARRNYEDGNLSEAIIYLFTYQLVELDKAQQIRLAKGKTNRQYVSELGYTSDFRPIIEQTMVLFEDTFFGEHEIARGDFDRCWSSLDRFHGLLKKA